MIRTRPASLVAIALLSGCGSSSSEGPSDPTYTRDIAPIVFAHCTECHRPGENAPFAFLTYDDVRKRARQVAEVTESRYMPPWLPAPGPDPFVRSRRLSDVEVATIRRWVEEGAVEGDAADLPAAPTFHDEWHMGPPDLVIEMPEEFTVPAGGEDIYRNFVIESPVEATRYVRAIEFRPGNARVVHHAFVLTDTTDGSRRQDETDPEPGFDGIHPPESAMAPGGFFLSWTPGRVPDEGLPGMSWRLEKGTDVVIQLHLQPSGKPEPVRSSVGLYFDDGPPTRIPYTVGLFDKDLDIPAGEANYVTEVDYVLPADVDVLAVLPHAHFLGKEMTGYALLPDGTRRDLLHIPQWDFNWQESYRYENPVFLPRGTKVAIRYVYDNSSANVWNPHRPPQRVTYGLQSADEMCEFWLQVLPRNPNDLEIIQADYEIRLVTQVETDARRALKEDPNDAQAHIRLGQSLFTQGKVEDALRSYRKALRIDPESADAYLFSSIVFEQLGNFDAAVREIDSAIKYAPDDAEKHFARGSLYYRADKLVEAGTSYQDAVRLNPEHFKANLQLGVVLARTGRPDLAIPYFETCIALRPDDGDAKRNLQLARSMLNR
ncbi:MAG: tetratricopeptide repeat protein [Planctomycetota bacterium]|jgi:Flp pilus assembly protein TadD